MPTLVPTPFAGTVTWLGQVADRAGSLRARPADRLRLTFDGAEGEAHSGLTRPACSRVSMQHPRGTEIRNVRQLTLLSEEELAEIAGELGLEAVDPEWLGATLVLRGIPDFSLVPPSSRLQAPDGATLVVDMENRPCNLPARVIEADAPGHGRAFKSAARRRRGVTAWVERVGEISPGDILRLHVPDQPAWPHLAEARRGAPEA